MSKTILVTALFCALLSAASAVVVFQDSSFWGVPLRVLTNTDVTNFRYPFLGRYKNDQYVAMWGFFGTGTSPVTYNAYLRLLDASTFTAVGNDTLVTLDANITSTPFFASSTDGYVVIAGVKQEVVGTTTDTESGTTTDVTQTSVTATICSSDASNSSVTTLTFGATTNSVVNYTIYSVWFDTDYFFIAYTELVSNVESGVYLVGFKTDGTNLTASPLALNTVTLSGTSGLKANSNGSVLIAAWRKTTQAEVVYIELNLANTSAPGNETVLAKDTTTVEFYPASIIFAENYYVILLSQVTSDESVGLTVSYSGNTTTSTLNFTLGSDYNTFTISAGDKYYDGWFIITRQLAESGGTISATEETLQVYNYTDTSNSTNSSNASTVITANNTQMMLLMDGSVTQGFLHPNSSYFIMVLNDYDGVTGSWTHAYVGQLFYKISFASVIQSVMTLMLAVATFFAIF